MFGVGEDGLEAEETTWSSLAYCGIYLLHAYIIVSVLLAVDTDPIF